MSPSEYVRYIRKEAEKYKKSLKHKKLLDKNSRPVGLACPPLAETHDIWFIIHFS